MCKAWPWWNRWNGILGVVLVAKRQGVRLKYGTTLGSGPFVKCAARYCARNWARNGTRYCAVLWQTIKQHGVVWLGIGVAQLLCILLGFGISVWFSATASATTVAAMAAVYSTPSSSGSAKLQPSIAEADAAAPPQAGAAPLWQSFKTECQGCHTETRLQPRARLANGFGKWQDQQCVGCHYEITDIARNRARGIADARYLSLPVTDAKLALISRSAMPYLNAPQSPWRLANANDHDVFVDEVGAFLRPRTAAFLPAVFSPELPASTGKDNTTSTVDVPRLDDDGLWHFLRRPHGRCDGSGCQAPTMMAYPQLEKTNIAKVVPWPLNNNVAAGDPNMPPTGSDVVSEQDQNAMPGQTLYQQRCQTCHDKDAKARYDAVGLALFDVRWLMQIPHQQQPFSLNKAEATALSNYFKQQRQQRQQQVDMALTTLESSWQQVSSTPLNAAEARYVWRDFWRDAACVHCHGIEGRARQRFNSDEAPLRQYLRSGQGKQIYYRLKIRQIEQRLGMSAAIPSMPMTGAALPEPFIELMGRWLKTGCPDAALQPQCSTVASRATTDR